jgi:hypothetical protein
MEWCWAGDGPFESVGTFPKACGSFHQVATVTISRQHDPKQKINLRKPKCERSNCGDLIEVGELCEIVGTTTRHFAYRLHLLRACDLHDIDGRRTVSGRHCHVVRRKSGVYSQSFSSCGHLKNVAPKRNEGGVPSPNGCAATSNARAVRAYQLDEFGHSNFVTTFL